MTRGLHICVIGGDGSGKTTLTKALCGSLKDSGAVYVWAAAESVLMKPVRFIVRRLGRLGRPAAPGERRAYAGELRQKHRFVRRFRLLTPLYVFAALADYALQYAVKVAPKRAAGRILVTDRYFYDVGVSIALALDWDEETLVKFIRRWSWLFRIPEIRVYLEVPASVATSRKDDIQSADYLELRLRFYRAIARALNFTTMDGSRSREEVHDDVLKRVLAYRGRVVFFHSNNVELGGADYCLRRLAVGVRDLDYDPVVILRLATPIVSQYRANGIEPWVVRFPRPRTSWGVIRGALHFLATAPAGAVRIALALRAVSPDIVHVNDLTDFLPAIVARLYRIPVVYHIRMIVDPGARNRLLTGIVEWTATDVLAVSDAVSRALERSDAPTAIVHTVRDWNDADLYAREHDTKATLHDELNLDHDTPLIGVVGRLETWKGQDVLLRAAPLVRVPPGTRDAVFVIIGDAAPEEHRRAFKRELERLAADLPDGSVRFLGERNDVPRLLPSLQLCVHTSTRPDPFPGTVIEGMLAGRPMIGADSGGVPELIQDGVTGRLFPPGDATALATVITEMLADVRRAELMGAAGRRRVVELTDRERILQQINAIYHSRIRR